MIADKKCYIIPEAFQSKNRDIRSHLTLTIMYEQICQAVRSLFVLPEVVDPLVL